MRSILQSSCYSLLWLLFGCLTNLNPAHADVNEQYAYTTDSERAAVLIRVGDIDNLGFQYPPGFDPFCGRNTSVHPYPWQAEADDHPGTDRITLGSGFDGGSYGDGYANTTRREETQPVPIEIKFPPPDFAIESVVVQLFTDDFQPRSFGSSYQFSVDGKRLPYIETVIAALNQTGPVGKLINLGILPEDLALFADGEVSLLIDYPLTNTGDGYAIDFVRLLINPVGDYPCAGTIYGTVRDHHGQPLAGVNVSVNQIRSIVSDAAGHYELDNVPTGIVAVTGSRARFNSSTQSQELNRDQRLQVDLQLSPREESDQYMLEQLTTQGFVNLYGIYFDTDRHQPKAESQSTLQAIATLLRNHPELQLELLGHTDADGAEDYNQTLSQRRAQSVIDWLQQAGIDPQRLRTRGLGETSPIASNDDASGKALNRRVELRRIR